MNPRANTARVRAGKKALHLVVLQLQSLVFLFLFQSRMCLNFAFINIYIYIKASNAVYTFTVAQFLAFHIPMLLVPAAGQDEGKADAEAVPAEACVSFSHS